MPPTASIQGMSLAQIRQRLYSRKPVSAKFVQELKSDPRHGVRRLWRLFCRSEKARQRAKIHLRRITLLERQLHRAGLTTVAGVDESGRGPLAGPLVAAAVIPPWPCYWFGLDDSKRLTAERRTELFHVIKAQATAVGVGIISSARIDAIGILPANWEAMRQAIGQLSLRPDHLLVDGPLTIPDMNLSQTPLVRGDSRSLSVAAASVVAKVTRDILMRRFDRIYPQYGFARHKGYGTREHWAALKQYGPCRIHRRSFRGVVVAEAGL